jgi:hypothetical protein
MKIDMSREAVMRRLEALSQLSHAGVVCARAASLRHQPAVVRSEQVRLLREAVRSMRAHLADEKTSSQ